MKTSNKLLEGNKQVPEGILKKMSGGSVVCVMPYLVEE